MRSQRRRYSKGSSEKTVLSMLQSKSPDDRLPKFVLKSENQPRLDISLSIWRKTVRLQKNKIQNFIESIELINKNVKKKQSWKIILSFCDLQKRNSTKKVPLKSAVAILSTLLTEDSTEDQYDFGNRRGSLKTVAALNRARRL